MLKRPKFNGICLSDSSSERSFNSEDSEANLAEVEDEQSDRESQVSCESLENDIAYANEPLADEEWLMEKKIIIINHVKHN